ncbi:hypothetical protein BDDG_05075 [Blastomyces dermatitidis ATCC 18188]|uniref:Uncharacterized protein n=1 Tax=Ajellomyces dermatitidis (strain ATCC 18188 / CBS 674.68) TaxID=653446 RepID=F2TFW9_AJEDA|nr:hypothetical protein BDDG_05075 [Blastomyces dermatitidis ATCC 18188]
MVLHGPPKDADAHRLSTFPKTLSELRTSRHLGLRGENLRAAESPRTSQRDARREHSRYEPHQVHTSVCLQTESRLNCLRRRPVAGRAVLGRSGGALETSGVGRAGSRLQGSEAGRVTW